VSGTVGAFIRMEDKRDGLSLVFGIARIAKLPELGMFPGGRTIVTQI
jgi:hypothetical protein